MVGKKLTGLVALLMGVSIFAGCAKSQSASSANQGALKDKKEITIGISQIVQHPALDAAKDGFLAALKEKGYEEGKNLKINFQNAQGDPNNSLLIAQKFVSDKVDMILAIATPSAQTAYKATKDIPILITAVTDPVGSGFAKSMEKSETNVTGTSDNVPVETQFDLLKKIVPNAKKVGIIYNTSETNSQAQVDNAKKVGPGMGLEIVAVGVTSTNDIAQAVTSLMGKVDALYEPTDNMIASSMPLLAQTCYKNNVPIIAAEKGMVESGAVATIGIDYYKLGYETGLKAVEVINGKKPTEVPISLLSDMKLVVNTDSVKKLNLTLPKGIDEKAEKVTGGK